MTRTESKLFFNLYILVSACTKLALKFYAFLYFERCIKKNHFHVKIIIITFVILQIMRTLGELFAEYPKHQKQIKNVTLSEVVFFPRVCDLIYLSKLNFVEMCQLKYQIPCLDRYSIYARFVHRCQCVLYNYNMVLHKSSTSYCN